MLLKYNAKMSINNPKYQDIYRTGKELFWKYGIKKVSIEEICREANVSKMTFYKFFPNKIELAKTILSELMKSSMHKFDTIVKQDISFQEKLESIFLLKIEAVNDFSQEFMNDIYTNSDSSLKNYLEESAKQAMQQVADFYKDAQDKRFIRKEVNINFIISFSSQMSIFMEDETLMAQYKNPIDFILEVMNMMFYGIVTRNE